MPTPTVQPQHLRAIMAEITGVMYEAHEHVEATMLAALAGQHTIMYGRPGVAKSMVARGVCSRITGATFKDVLLSRMLPDAELFGPVSLQAMKQDRHTRRIDGYLPTAHIWFLDEIGKAGPTVLNPLLKALNERQFDNDGVVIDIPLLFCVAASNEQLEPELAAIRDRFLVHIEVDTIQEDSNFAAFLTDPFDEPVTATVTLEQFEQAMAETKQVTVPATVAKRVVQLRHELRDAAQSDPSPRRWRAAMDLARASAWLNGRSSVDEDDLAPLRHALWEVPEHRTEVVATVMGATGEFTRKVTTLARIITEQEQRINASGGKSQQARATAGADMLVKLADTATQLRNLRELAARDGRDLTAIDAQYDRALALRKHVMTDLLNMPESAAATAASKV